MYKILTTFCLLTFCFLQLNAQIPLPGDRKVLFLHGKGESSSQWQLVAELFEAERQLDQGRVFYESNLGLDFAVNKALNRFNNTITFPNNTSSNANSIAVCQSMGGVVARGIDKLTEGQTFGGIITVGTPNYGTYLPINIQNGTAAERLAYGVSSLQAGPSSTLGILVGGIHSATLPMTLDLMIANIFFGANNSSFVGNLSSLLVNETIDQSAIELSTGSEKLMEINAYSSQSSTPMISIWGHEDSPVHWRLVSSVLNNPNPSTDLTPNNDDETWVENAENIESYYKTARAVTAIAGASSIVLSFIPGVGFGSLPLGGVLLFSAVQWSKGIWWLNRSEEIWIDLNRCGTTVNLPQELTITYVGVDCDDYGFTGTPEWVNCIEDNCGGYIENCSVTEDIIAYYPFFYDEDSDGFVCGTSQRLQFLPPENIYEAIGSNHVTESNLGDPVEKKLRDIWNKPNTSFTTLER
jgi:hypothetical protein